MVSQISSHPAVQRVVVLGTLCALELRAEGSNAGYDGFITLFLCCIIVLYSLEL